MYYFEVYYNCEYAHISSTMFLKPSRVNKTCDAVVIAMSLRYHAATWDVGGWPRHLPKI